jgi:hypothetical protein
MKKILILALTLITSLGFAQTDSTKVKTTGYTSLGLALSNNSDFKTGAFTSLETGLQRNNIAVGIIFGRGSLAGLGRSNDNLSNYFYELKTTGYFPLGSVTGSVIFGWGGYFKTQHSFIEYGGGISYSVGKMGYGVTYSNWDGTNYLTPCITLNF